MCACVFFFVQKKNSDGCCSLFKYCMLTYNIRALLSVVLYIHAVMLVAASFFCGEQVLKKLGGFLI